MKKHERTIMEIEKCVFCYIEETLQNYSTQKKDFVEELANCEKDLKKTKYKLGKATNYLEQAIFIDRVNDCEDRIRALKFCIKEKNSCIEKIENMKKFLGEN